MRAGIRASLIAAAAGLALAGCGIRGSLDTPAEAKAEGTANSAQSGAAGQNSAAAPKPFRGFVLDPLLR